MKTVTPVRLITTAMICALLTIAGCAKEAVRYGDARGVETVTNEFGSTDLQMITESMTRSMLNSPVIASNNLPIVTVQDVKNKTSEYIDTKSITDSIRVELQKSGKVRFAVDAAEMRQQIEELQRQQSEYYDSKQSAEIGKMSGAAYRLEGNITSIVKQAKEVKDVYYKFNLQLWNIQSGLLEWTDEKEIRKTTSK
ncbi:MAG TPA: penicillin-binding protein activator LpoB [Burkholderiales bacterium]|nr:penicillin-binding protein activator LpoB [Burkholderiales bacterium]